jgi:hypothetical protein
MGLVCVPYKANNDRAWRGCAIEAESKGDKQRRLMLARSSLPFVVRSGAKRVVPDVR